MLFRNSTVFSLSLAIVAFTPSHAFAEELQAQLVDGKTHATTAAPEEAKDEDSPSFLRAHTYGNSFDAAGDATREAELELKKGISVQCSEDKLGADHAAAPVIAQRMQDCQQRAREAQGFAQDAEGIRKAQRMIADVSRVSDAAAVVSIGAVGYAELIQKKKGQANTLESAAKIQETAGYASYATGAADMSMGAYAYAVQKRKLEKMKDTLSGISNSVQLTPADSEVITKLTNAAEKTKSAAYSHMLYGAGKVAIGYASMKLAERNRNQAKSLSSIDTTSYATGAAAAAPNASVNSGAPVYYQNNAAGIMLPTDTDATTASTTGSGDAVAGGGGASVMPGMDALGSRGLASAPSSGLGGSGSSAGAKSASGSSSTPTADADKKDDALKAAAGPSFEMNLGAGGGASRYGGGSKSSGTADETPSTPLVVGGGANGDSKSSATGVNAHSLYKDAMEGMDGAQGNMAGVSGSGKTLFDVVKTKYNKMMEVGRLQGPGAVEVRN